VNPRGNRRRRTLLFVCGLMWLLPGTAHAHSFAPAVLDLRERDVGRFDVIWKLPGPGSGVLTPGDHAPLPQLPVQCRTLAGAPSMHPGEEGPAFWQVDCGPAAMRGQPLSVSGLDGTRIDVIVRITWHDGTTASGVLRSASDQFVMPTAGPSRVQASGAPARAVLWSYMRLGVEHILLGPDHLLFVLGLLLLVDSWGMLLKTISAFTLAHSLSLALAVLDVVQLPAAPVEALIALSIVLVALELTRAPATPPTLARRYPWAVAFAFGLLHGLGFAGALAQIGLPPDQIALALVAFNVGVEIGQLLFVAAMLVPRALLMRITAAWPAARLIPPYAIGALATTWVFERVQRFWM
jgi:hypothetical protein